MTPHESSPQVPRAEDPLNLYHLAKEIYGPLEKGNEFIDSFQVLVDRFEDTERSDLERSGALAIMQSDILMTIDGLVAAGDLDEEKARGYYDRLGLTAAERSRFRGPSA